MTAEERVVIENNLVIAGCRCPIPRKHGIYDAIAGIAYCASCTISLRISILQLSNAVLARRQAAGNAIFTPLPPGSIQPLPPLGRPVQPTYIPSAHGGKPIPVVPSHSAIAAAAKGPEPRRSANSLTYKTHVLVGRSNGGGVWFITLFEHLPQQKDMDAAIKNSVVPDGTGWASFALLSPTNVWNA